MGLAAVVMAVAGWAAVATEAAVRVVVAAAEVEAGGGGEGVGGRGGGGHPDHLVAAPWAHWTRTTHYPRLDD